MVVGEHKVNNIREQKSKLKHLLNAGEIEGTKGKIASLSG